MLLSVTYEEKEKQIAYKMYLENTKANYKQKEYYVSLM